MSTNVHHCESKKEGFLALLLPLQRLAEVYCRRLLRNSSDVEDVLQTAVAEAFARFDRYTEGTNFRAWFFRFVTLEAFNRNRKREPVFLHELADDVVTSFVEEPQDLVGLLAKHPGPVMEQLDEQIAGALARLTSSERAVLLLRAIGDFSYKEIHEILSIPLGSVMGYLSRARKKMRNALADFAIERGLSSTVARTRDC